MSGVRVPSGSLFYAFTGRKHHIPVSYTHLTFRSSSVAAIGVAAHECGHAIQDAESYAPLKIRGAIVPVVNLSLIHI